jgi:5-formyltetrahydrofolate cyclo-ligase
MHLAASAASRAGIKKEARKAAAAARQKAHQADRGVAGATLAMTGLDFLDLPAGTVVSGFLPYQTEIDVRPLLARLAASGLVTALPVVTGRGEPLIFRAWRPGEPIQPGAWNIPVPRTTAAEVVPDVLLVPMLAFDSGGFRLGYGGGFYDRTLEKLRRDKPVIAVGVAYAGQEVHQVPRGPHDQPLDWILTETGACRVRLKQGEG